MRYRGKERCKSEENIVVFLVSLSCFIKFFFSIVFASICFDSQHIITHLHYFTSAFIFHSTHCLSSFTFFASIYLCSLISLFTPMLKPTLESQLTPFSFETDKSMVQLMTTFCAIMWCVYGASPFFRSTHVPLSLYIYIIFYVSLFLVWDFFFFFLQICKYIQKYVLHFCSNNKNNFSI